MKCFATGVQFTKFDGHLDDDDFESTTSDDDRAKKLSDLIAVVAKFAEYERIDEVCARFVVACLFDQGLR